MDIICFVNTEHILQNHGERKLRLDSGLETYTLHDQTVPTNFFLPPFPTNPSTPRPRRDTRESEYGELMYLTRCRKVDALALVARTALCSLYQLITSASSKANAGEKYIVQGLERIENTKKLVVFRI